MSLLSSFPVICSSCCVTMPTDWQNGGRAHSKSFLSCAISYEEKLVIIMSNSLPWKLTGKKWRKLRLSWKKTWKRLSPYMKKLNCSGDRTFLLPPESSSLEALKIGNCEHSLCLYLCDDKRCEDLSREEIHFKLKPFTCGERLILSEVCMQLLKCRWQVRTES